MNYYLSLETCKKLREWGCDVCAQKQYSWIADIKCLFEDKTIPMYDLRDIICDGEMAKKFFGEELLCYDCGEKVGKPLGNDVIQIGTGTCVCGRQFENNEEAWEYHSKFILMWTQQNKKEEAEQYLLDNCIFNPDNK